jgi:hypothetical protein
VCLHLEPVCSTCLTALDSCRQCADLNKGVRLLHSRTKCNHKTKFKVKLLSSGRSRESLVCITARTGAVQPTRRGSISERDDIFLSHWKYSDRTWGPHTLVFIYEGLFKIFRTDVKIIQLTIRPIGRNLSRASSLPHVDTGPTVSIFGMLPGSPVKHSLLFGLNLLIGIKPTSFKLQFIFLEIGRSHRVPNQRSTMGVGMTAILY